MHVTNLRVTSVEIMLPRKALSYFVNTKADFCVNNFHILDLYCLCLSKCVIWSTDGIKCNWETTLCCLILKIEFESTKVSTYFTSIRYKCMCVHIHVLTKAWWMTNQLFITLAIIFSLLTHTRTHVNPREYCANIQLIGMMPFTSCRFYNTVEIGPR